jgi:hypothetical protein
MDHAICTLARLPSLWQVHVDPKTKSIFHLWHRDTKLAASTRQTATIPTSAFTASAAETPTAALGGLSQEEAIVGIESGKWAFYVFQQGRTAEVIVATSAFGHKYLKTVADGQQPDNLLSLPECR